MVDLPACIFYDLITIDKVVLLFLLQSNLAVTPIAAKLHYKLILKQSNFFCAKIRNYIVGIALFLVRNWRINDFYAANSLELRF